ncbi:CoA transferase [Bacillus sp. SB49]|uniref:CaiB/BaiF CoA transferase family protein n=1 Tax=Bacillaceae TaxID=186817 RepID=UPI0002A50414|nr:MULTISPECIES: CoA transferase [Bacillaceae]ELK44670.1 CAIB/BAIF family protein [Halobacillus sp. BAB-2008]QHT46995.1 CoA transferase [Bacillus sp. SB49]
MTTALSGIRVLDLSRVLAGPYCSMILGDLGAEVIKVEAPGGSDDTRTWGPPFQQGVSAYYLCANRNKKSLTVDLKTAEGQAIIRELASRSDVLLHNFKTGSMEKFGLDYESMSELHPALIYCSITGFGETGPYSHLPGYDFIIQAMSGLMAVTGTPQSGPQKTGVAISDILTGLYAAIGIQAALLERQHTNKGQKIDLSLLDSAVSALVNIGSNFLMTGEEPTRMGNHHANIAPYQMFKTKDGEVIVAVGNDRQFYHFCNAVQKPELSEDPRFCTNAVRVKNREELTAILQKTMEEKKTAYWLKICRDSQIPIGPVHTLTDVVQDEQLMARDMFVTANHPAAGPIRMVGSPLKLSGSSFRVNHAPPEPGEHTIEILNMLGYSREIIDEWKKKRII